jgi:hypothetical protein
MKSKWLLELADLLDGLPPKRFNFNSWVGSSWRGAPDLSCGTTACALGWATTIKKFGLVLRRSSCGSGYVELAQHKEVTAHPGLRSLQAACIAFDLTSIEAEFLFLPDEWGNGLSSFATSRMLARHIRDFVAGEIGPITPDNDDDN